ncbi:MAG TPA: FKBP-type peptidyl-prolyl cis-trans isomerase [Thiotrichales bacterium]|nr:FKBP-type peptidyl-prolyl cis-trans isomerase [Thiotrichales bacterium]
MEILMKKWLIPGLLSAAVATPVLAGDEVKLDTVEQKVSYGFGMKIGRDIAKQGLKIDADALAAAIRDVLKGEKPRLTPEELKTAMETYRNQLIAEQHAKAEANAKAGEAYLAENARKPGVKSLPSGLQYKVVQQGNGPKPKATDTVSVHYEGRLIDGTVFDSSYKRGKPTSFRVSNVIKGWQEALQLMPVGSKWQIVIPADLAYGTKGAGDTIGPNSTLVFDVELLEIKDK